VIHAFIDGFSRLVTGIRANNNNRGESVLTLFEEARAAHGTPSRVRGDHGVENLLVAAMMEYLRGMDRSSYIFGK
jgi:transposase InsO family protein